MEIISYLGKSELEFGQNGCRLNLKREGLFSASLLI